MRHRSGHAVMMQFRLETYLVFGALGVEHGEEHLAVSVAFGLVRSEDFAQRGRGWLAGQHVSGWDGLGNVRRAYLVYGMPSAGEDGADDGLHGGGEGEDGGGGGRGRGRERGHGRCGEGEASMGRYLRGAKPGGLS